MTYKGRTDLAPQFDTIAQHTVGRNAIGVTEALNVIALFFVATVVFLLFLAAAGVQ